MAILLFAVGGGMSFYEGVAHLRHPAPMQDPTASYVVLALAFVFESVLFAIAVHRLRAVRAKISLWQAVRASKVPSVFMVVGEDLAALVGLAAPFSGVLLTRVTGS